MRSSEMTTFGFAPARDMDTDEIGEIVDVDHGGLDAGPLQPVEAVIDEGAPADVDQRLRHGGGQGPHALAESGGKDHGPFRADRRHSGHGNRSVR